MTDAAHPSRVLVFGASGAIGSAVAQYFESEGWFVTRVARRALTQSGSVAWDPRASGQDEAWVQVGAQGPFDAVCWAQGANCNDSAYRFDRETHMALYDANVLYVLESMNALLTGGLLAKPARLCVVSSIWQDMARQEKLSYCVTKAALQGLVLSAANDLARDGHLVNAVLPGVLDTPMSRRNLRPDQIQVVESSTQFKRLAKLDDVSAAVFSLCSPRNTGLTAQFIKVDLGYSNVRII